MTLSALIPPGLVLIIGGLLLPFFKQARPRQLLVLGTPVLVLFLIWNIPNGHVTQLAFLDYTLTPIKVDALSRVFATIFSIVSFVGGLYAIKQEKILELVAAFAYAGSAIGVVMAGDLITVFIFWELMAVGSTLVIWAAGTESAYRASMRYLSIHLLGGVILMAGILGHIHNTGSIDFVAMQPTTISTALILVGFLINAGAPPFSGWLPDAYPEASFSGTVFLSAFTTKTAVYVLIRGFPGAEILIYIGVFMIFYGIIYAMLENDIRRILAYSIINQMGFMVTGIGIGTTMALNGAAAHAFTHIIYKALLLMTAGAVIYRTGKRKCTDLGGLFQSMPLTTVCVIIGAMAASAFPFTSGFASKALISQGVLDQHATFVWFALVAASAGAPLHAGIKYPLFVFFQKDSGLRPKDPPLNMRIPMMIFAFLCIALGVYPDALYSILPNPPMDYALFTVPHVVNMLQLLLFAALAFFLLLSMAKQTLTITLDFDWFYRKLFPSVVTGVTPLIARAFQTMTAQTQKIVMDGMVQKILHIHSAQGFLAQNRLSGTTVLGMSALLGLYLVLLYIF
ncbi:Na(+)/H(+) antiporter subunit D [Magnetococcales bacterium HHB-1]